MRDANALRTRLLAVPPVRADELRCSTVSASASMGGDIEAYASETSDASASMGGAISIAGNPRSNNSTAMGGSISN